MEKKEMIEALQAELKTFKEGLPTYATPEDLDNKVKGIEEKFGDVASAKDLQEIKDAAIKQGEILAKMQAGTPEKIKSVDETLKELTPQVKSMLDNRHGKVSFELKTDVTRSSVTSHTLAMRLPEVGQLAYKATKLEPLFSSGTVSANSNGIIRYVDQSAATRNAAWKAEAAQKPESAITWQEYTLNVEKIADTIPVTMEAMNDVGFIASEIRNLLLNNLNLKIDTDLYSGSGSTPIIYGAYTRADTYTAAAAGIGGANIYDLILKVQEDIVDGSQYAPNICLVSYADYNEMLLTKEATTNSYINPGWAAPIIGGGQPEMNVNGIRVIPSASVTANTMLLGDFNYATIYNLGGVMIDMGWIDKQFVENMVTLRAERRLGMLIRNVHTDAFRKVTDVDAALTTLAS